MYCLIVVPLYVYCWFFQMLILRCIVLGSSRSPECVMVCILPASVPSHDVTFHIQQTLVEAFCVEHAIPILKVTAITFLGRKILMTYNHDNCNNSHPCVICIDFSTRTNATEKYDWVRDVHAMFDVKMSVYDAGNHSWCSRSVVHTEIKAADFCIVWSCG